MLVLSVVLYRHVVRRGPVRTVAQLVALAVAVDAQLDLALADALRLRAGLGAMAPLLAVEAALQARVDGIAGVVEASKELGTVSRPAVTLTGASRLLGEAVGHSVLLASVAMHVHVGKGAREGALKGNEPQVDLVVNEAALDVTERGGVAKGDHGLDVLLQGLLGIVNVTLLDGLFNAGPSLVGSDVLDMITVDGARLVTLLGRVA